MAKSKMMAGHALRRLRRRLALTQVLMAEELSISPSYLTLLERNQRPLTATLMVRLAERFDFDPRVLIAAEPGGGGDAIRRRLADPMFGDLEIDRSEVEEWLAAAPGTAEAFARAFDRADSGVVPSPRSGDPIAAARTETERWRNHFADLDDAGEKLADELRLASPDPFGAMVERLRIKHQISLRILPVDVLPDTLRRLDLHARQLQLSEILTPPGRTFAVAYQLGQLEVRGEIDALARGAAFDDRVADRLFRRHLHGYFAASVLMPYARFLRACENSNYDLELLQRRFGASFEQVAHRLTTLQRVGARGLPFFLIRIDRAGQTSKRYSGASGSALVAAPGRCPLWGLHRAFDRLGRTTVDLVELEDGERWFTIAAAVIPQGVRDGDVRAEFVVGIGVAADQAHALKVAHGIDLSGRATPIGLGCRACRRMTCPQRSAPPAGRTLIIDESRRGPFPFSFSGD